MVKPIFRTLRAPFEALSFLSAVHRYNADMSYALHMLPRLLRNYIRDGSTGHNLRPQLVYWFGRRDRIDNLITQNKPWLYKLANFLNSPDIPENNTLSYVFAYVEQTPGINVVTLESKHIEFKIQRGNLTLIDGPHKILHIPDYGRHEKITTMLANDFWAFLATTKFYCNEIDYIAIENCDPMISYISTCPCENININGESYSLFACPSSILKPILGTETLRA